MRVSKTELFNQKVWEAEFKRSLKAREDFYRQLSERRKCEYVDRVTKNIRLGLDKGRNVDIDC